VNSIQQTFADSRQARRGVLIVYVTAGDPSLEETVQIVTTVADAGADIVELGIPYSDPLADGPTIQAASQRALEAGATIQGVFDCAAQIRQRSSVPLVIMTCYNPILQFGPEAFAQEASNVGIDGILASDLPPSEAEQWCAIAAEHELATVFLVAPTTPPERVARAVECTTGFVYAVARPGVTGARDELPEDLKDSVAHVRQVTDLPIAVGFGISTPQQVATVCQIADGAIVGSAVINIIAEANDRESRLQQVSQFVSALAASTRW